MWAHSPLFQGWGPPPPQLNGASVLALHLNHCCLVFVLYFSFRLSRVSCVWTPKRAKSVCFSSSFIVFVFPRLDGPLRWLSTSISWYSYVPGVFTTRRLFHLLRTPFFSLSHLVEATIRGHIAGSSPLSPPRFVPRIFIAIRLQLFLPSTARVGLSLPRLGALGS